MASKSTFYRVAKRMKRIGPKRCRRVVKRDQPKLCADGPGQVVCWDITYLKGPGRPRSYALYAVIDIFSRKIIEHLVAPAERADLAAMWFEQILQNYPTIQTVHADNGAAMTSKAVYEVFEKHNVNASHSRPHVSNDNAFIESWFKTLKHHIPNYPHHFDNLTQAQTWIENAIDHYNNHHHHSQMGGFTPNQIHNDTWQIQATLNQQTRLNHYNKHPERYHQPPKPQTLPKQVKLHITTPQPLTTT